MIERDRDLLARAARVNNRLGTAVSDLMSKQDSGELPAAELRAIGASLGELAAEFLARASELDGRRIDTPNRVIIDARSE